ncbi:HNH endonuclease [Arthrobacter bambusae]|uniref:HNH endonuclease n=1 Tax=Arthrobacter bambusae TaxID=1338426 RepID=UPI001F50A2C5|nr:HNH endonuclease [Arthrobacter bambusae]MCI0143186.1 HNH endonuclease [Arthrobacter bambusae]
MITDAAEILDDFDDRLRAAAFAWLTSRTFNGSGNLTYSEIQSFSFEGQRIPLKDRVKGIWKPASLRSALSITTTYRPPGVVRPYDDLIHESDGLLRYKWNGIERDEATNRALRSAMQLGVPLIWFFGVGKGVFKPVFPVFVVGEEEANRQFILDADPSVNAAVDESAAEQFLRRYLKVETRHRLFQAVFRGTVMRAYEGRCAVCSLQHGQLLDAAHIIPDSDEDGVASVVNGMALCKIHHAAFDFGILGIRPDLVVQIQSGLMHEIDGPMLRHGLQEMHGKRVSVPSAKAERPRADLLERAFERFRQAG